MRSTESSSCKTILKGMFVVFCLHCIIRFEQIREHGDFESLDMPDDDVLPPIELSTMEDFPTSGTNKVPKIIHQTWMDTNVPQVFVPWVKSWIKTNPDWQYWFWTDDNTRQFIAEKYPDFLPVFDAYPEGIRRADAMRYFILYEFGGVYADLDVESLQSLNPLIKKYHCFLGQEPYVHSVLDSNFEHLVINAVMGCRKGHPFMKMLMDNLPKFAHMWHVLDSTGPHFMTFWFKEYYNMHKYSEVHENGTYLTPSQYFFPSYDPTKSFAFHSLCSSYKSLNIKQKRACKHLKATGLQPINLKLSFTNHHWIHTYAFMFRLPLKGPVDIHKLHPNVVIH